MHETVASDGDDEHRRRLPNKNANTNLDAIQHEHEQLASTMTRRVESKCNNPQLINTPPQLDRRQSAPARLKQAQSAQTVMCNCNAAQTICRQVVTRAQVVEETNRRAFERLINAPHLSNRRSFKELNYKNSIHDRDESSVGLNVASVATTVTKTTTTCSPLCSSSSDSAFSQSQTTLGGSESETNLVATTTSTCYSTSSSSTSSSSSSSSSSTNKKHSSIDLKQPDQLSSDDDLLGTQHEQFTIVWKNLTYKIPEKRYTRWMEFLDKLRAKWLSPQTCNIIASKQAQSNTNIPMQHCCNDNKNIQNNNCDQANISQADDENTNTRVQTKQRQVIFSNLNGCVSSGQLTAILGPSGAGKTTFLKCLTNTIVKGVSGSITIHHQQKTLQTKTSQQLKLCIIPQKDFLFDNLTVMENLLFASRIKNTQAQFNHKDNVHRVTNLLGLQACLRLKTGKLSGGQYKRVSIAQELLSQPDILILDEPTSGLDSLTCFRTVSVLRDLADMAQSGLMPPLAIIMTIHQPQIKIFNLFHHVYILSSLGQCVYEGRPEYLIDTVADRCNLLPPHDDQNPASFIIDLASEVYGPKPIEQLIELQRDNFQANCAKLVCSEIYSNDTQAVVFVADQQTNVVCHNKQAAENQFMSNTQLAVTVQFASKPNNHNIQPDDYCASCTTDVGELKISEQLRKRNNHEHSFWLHTSLLMRRLWISMWRDSLLTTTRITFHIIIPFVFYFVYSQKSGSANACPHVEREMDIQDMVSDSNIQRLTIQHDELILTFENVSLFFLLLYSFSMCVLAVTALSFPLNMQILLKETTNGWYTMPRFVMAKTLADLPIELTMPMISVSIAYAITGQPSSYLCWRMLSVTAVMTLCSLISQTQGLLFGAYFMNNVQAAVFVSQASTLPWIMLSGFTTRVSQLPKLLQWLSFGSIYRLGIESIVSVRYGFGMCPCDEESVNNSTPKIVGIPDQVRSVMSYYMDMYSDSSQQTITTTTTTTNSSLSLNETSQLALANSTTPLTVNSANNQSDIFGKIASTLSRANTYGADIVSCDDVRPFIMSAREVDETTLPIFLGILLSVLLGLKILLFFVVRIRAG